MRQTMAIGMAVMLAACGKSAASAKTERCEKIWANLVSEASKLGDAFGKDLSEQMGAEAMKEFVKTCKATPDDLLGCLEDPTSQPDCEAKVRAQVADNKKHAPAVTLTWEPVPFDHDRATGRAPKGWTHDDFMNDKYTPPKDAHLGVFTVYELGSDCAGACDKLSAADWAKRIDTEVLAAARNGFAVDKDEALGPTGRLIISHNKSDSDAPAAVHVLAVWWSDGAERYVTCKAELDDQIAGAVGEFEQACRDVQVKSWSAEY